MKFSLELHLEGKPGGDNTAEIYRHLRETAEHVEHHFYVLKMKPQSRAIKDQNGQIIGHWKAEE